MALFLAACGSGKEELVIEPVSGFAGLVVADEPRAAVIGQDLLATGGNAADAAVAMFFAMTVTLPSRVGLGGDGLCLAFDQEARGAEQISFRRSVSAASGRGPRAVRAMALLHARHGLMPWSALVSPAEGLARFGHPVSRAFAQDLAQAASLVARAPVLARLFGSARGGLLREGERLSQFELSTVLTGIRSRGAGYFYGGGFVEPFAADLTAAGWPLSPAELRRSVPDLSAPLELPVGSETLYLPAPPATSGLATGQVWQILSELRDYRAADPTQRPGLLLDALRRAGTDRSDPAARLSRDHLQQLLAATLDAGGGRAAVAPGAAAATVGSGFVVGDRWGNAVACSVSLNRLFGAGRTAGPTGVLLPAPDAGAWEPAVALLGHAPSGDGHMALAGGDGGPALAALSAALLAVLLDKLPMTQAVDQPRVVWDQAGQSVLHETTLPSAVRQSLQNEGYALRETGPLGQINGFHCAKGLADYDKSCSLARDPRGWGLAIIVQ